MAVSDPASSEVPSLIDHTLLRPEATRSEIAQLCDEALRYGFFAVCVAPVWVAEAAARLNGSPVRVATVVGFPLGASMTPVKRLETELALRCGAQEIDMVVDLGALKAGDGARVHNDILGVVELASAGGALTKVILETGLLSDEQKRMGAELAVRAGAAFVKTSTGFSHQGATGSDVTLLRRAVGSHAGVKAAGGIRSYSDLLAMVRAGANRIGTSAGVSIVEQARGSRQ